VTHNNLGLLHLGRGDLAAAERLFRRELELNPGYDKAHFNLGLALARQGRVAEAALSWREALRLDPTNQDAKTNLDQVQAMLGGVAPAGMQPVDADNLPTDVLQRLYESALERQPENDAIRRAYVEFCRRRGLNCP
jgi:tetratricopeptide (TPR) repeat protein